MAPSPSTDDSDTAGEQRFNAERQDLVREIEDEFRLTAEWTGRDAPNRRVHDAIARVPRHAFVPEVERSLSYVNTPLPIGWGQTISQPFIVALMTDLLDPEPGDVVLEVGTGSGYQAAVLSLLVAKVYSIEVVAELAERAADVLARLGYANVDVRGGDGARGWPDKAPFDKIIVTAEAAEIPRDLIDQLAPGGRLIMPVEDAGIQLLTVLNKRPDGATDRRELLPVAFVPLRSPT
jgi:protein-L-isoaspartate(D-aspartate) O-methyltransferase